MSLAPDQQAELDAARARLEETDSISEAAELEEVIGDLERLEAWGNTHLADLMDEYGDGADSSYDDIRELAAVDAAGPFILVQRNLKSSPTYWISSHSTLSDVAEYVVGEEYAEDWATETVVDISTGDVYDEGHRTVTFVKVED